MEDIYNTLRAANVARNIEWTAGASIEDYTWRGCELAGEVGEVVELFDRGDSAAWNRKVELAEELADVVICIDLSAMTLGLPEVPIHSSGFIERAGPSIFARNVGGQVLLLLNDFKKLERERRGWPGSRSSLEYIERRLHRLMGQIGLLAAYYHIELRDFTEAKFNATSEKVGLATRLYFRAPDRVPGEQDVPVAESVAEAVADNGASGDNPANM